MQRIPFFSHCSALFRSAGATIESREVDFYSLTTTSISSGHWVYGTGWSVPVFCVLLHRSSGGQRVLARRGFNIQD